MYVKVAANIEQLKASMAEARAEIAKVGESGKSSLDGFSDRLEHLGERVAEYFALREVAHFVEGLLEGAHALEILSQQTDISVEELQVLGAATAEFGIDTEKLGTLIFQLSRRIAGGDESAAAALHMMGMSMDEVKGLQGEELFLTIARGLNTLEGNARDLAATDLFGGRAGKQVLAFSQDVDGAMEAVRGSVSVASEESVKNLAAMEVQITRMQTSFHNWATEVLGEVAQGFNVLKDANTQGASKWEIFVAMVKDAAESTLPGVGASTRNLTQLLLDHNVVAKDSADATAHASAAHKEAAVALDAHAQAEKFMAALILDNAKPILDWQRQDLDQLREMGALTAKNAEAIGVNAAQLKVYEQGVKASAEATKQWNEIVAKMDKETFTLAMEHEKQWRKEQQDRLKLTNEAILAEFDAQRTLNAEWGLNAAGAIQIQTSALDVLNQKLTVLHASRLEGISQEKQEQVLMDEYTQALLAEAQAQDAENAALAAVPPLVNAANSTVKQFTGTLSLGITNIDAFNKALSDFYDQFAGSNVGTPEVAGANVPVILSNGGRRTIQPRASGGPVDAGSTYIVGERGPETLVMGNANGFIVPNGAGSAGSAGATQIIQLVVDGRVLAAVVNDHITRTMRQSRQFPVS